MGWLARPYLPVALAPTAHAADTKTVLVSLPPKPPPIRFILATTLFIGRPAADAQKVCVLVTACVLQYTVMPSLSSVGTHSVDIVSR
jgi:hypothetical protein